jgi:hypothetical protein
MEAVTTQNQQLPIHFSHGPPFVLPLEGLDALDFSDLLCILSQTSAPVLQEDYLVPLILIFNSSF